MEWTILAGFKYTKKHEWLKLDESGNTATVGITDYAQDKLGSIVFVEFPDVGTEVAAGDSVAVIESVKAVTDTYTPVAGVIAEVNEALLDQPEVINEDPYGDGWMVKLELAEGYDFSALLNEKEYEEHIRKEEEE
jgi:glycine cleavage system H protein